MLVHTVTPMPDESLAGLIARAAGINVYPHASDIVRQAGFGIVRPESLAIRSPGSAERLAEVFGTTPELLYPLYYPARGDRHIEFFGTLLRDAHREAYLRRVSPRALRDAQYVRAVWSLKPLSFDPVTMERLISSCPVCQGTLGFTQTWGVEYCEHCVREDCDGLPMPMVDLRDYPQELIQVEDEEALNFVTALIDPNPDRRRGSMPTMHDSLHTLDRGQLFELAVAIGSALMLNDDTSRAVDPSNVNRGGVQEVDPVALSKAGRAIISWPKGFVDLCESQAKGMARRENVWGIYKELGALGNLRRDPHLDLETKDVLASATEQYFQSDTLRHGIPRSAAHRGDGGYVGGMELCSKFNVTYDVVLRMSRHPDVLTLRGDEGGFSILNFMRWQAEAILRNYKALVPESTLSFRMGVPAETIRDFANDLLLRRAEGVEATLTSSGQHYVGSDLTDILAVYEHIMPRGEKKPGYITFGDAMLMFPAGRRPWFALWDAIFYDRVSSYFHREPTKNLVDAVSVRLSDIDKDSLLARMRELPVPDLDRVTIGNANLMLGIYVYPVFTACVEAGLLSVGGDKMVPYDKVMDFAGEFMLTNEIGMRSGISRQKLRSWLELHGVQPAIDLEVKGGLIYDRAKVEALL